MSWFMGIPSMGCVGRELRNATARASGTGF